MRHEGLARSLGALIRPLAALAILAVAISAPAAEDEVRNLLRELWLQVPPPEMGAPLFSLPDVGGTAVRLADHRGRPVMLYFWTTW